jgi:SAM-dependent methyltransferase
LNSEDLPLSSKAYDRSTLIELLRGGLSCPLIAAFGVLGLADKLLAGPVSKHELELNGHPEVLGASLDYLISIGLLSSCSDSRYALTETGRMVFRRHGAFSLLHSYHKYFNNLAELLSSKTAIMPTVERGENVVGSGALHAKKFFPAALRQLELVQPKAIIDIGCGDGTFLEYAHTHVPNAQLAVIDYSQVAIDATTKRFSEYGIDLAAAITSDGSLVGDWAAQLPASFKTESPVVFTIWFVAHEFSRRSETVLIDFFKTMNATFPRADIILGEIVNLPNTVLAENARVSIMPEYLFFHRLSGQGVMSWEAWQRILSQTPYSLAAEVRFDEVRTQNAHSLPSSFVWHLKAPN